MSKPYLEAILAGLSFERELVFGKIETLKSVIAENNTPATKETYKESSKPAYKVSKVSPRGKRTLSKEQQQKWKSPDEGNKVKISMKLKNKNPSEESKA